MKNNYQFIAIFEYEEDGINIYFPDLPEAISCANNTQEAMKNAEEVLGLVLYGKEENKEKIPEPTTLKDIEINGNKKAVIIDIWMPLVRNELEEQAIKKTLTIPKWLNQIAESKKVNFSKVLQAGLKDYLKINHKNNK